MAVDMAKAQALAVGSAAVTGGTSVRWNGAAIVGTVLLLATAYVGPLATPAPAGASPGLPRAQGQVDPPGTFTNPLRGERYNPIFDTITVDDYYHGDPRVVRDGARYVGSGSGCKVMVSDDMVDWRYAATRLDAAGRPVPVDVCGSEPGLHPPAMELHPTVGQNVNFWGTEVLKVGDRWVLVTSGARHWPDRGTDYTRGAIFVGTAAQPQGPYTWAADATVMTPDATLIDPTIFTDPVTGAHWLLWAQRPDYPTRSDHKFIVTQRLDPADVTRVAPGSSSVTLLGTDVDPQPRERSRAAGARSVEGPGMVYADGGYFLHYAAGNCEYDYVALGGAAYTFNVARADRFPVAHTAAGAFAKPDEPLISGGNGWRLPGHGAVYQDGAGDYWVVNSPIRDGEPYCESGSVWCMTMRTVAAQRLSYSPALRAFVADNPLVDPGPIDMPAG